MRKAMTGFIGDARREMVPHAGIEPALLSELDFESSASTSSANGARHLRTIAVYTMRLRAATGKSGRMGMINYPCGDLQWCGT